MNGKLVIGASVGLVVGLGAGWLSGGAAAADRDEIAEQLKTVELERDTVAGERESATSELETVKRRLARLDRELNEARASLASTETKLEDAQAAAVAAAKTSVDLDDGGDHSHGNGALGEGQAFSFPAYDEHLSAVNWTDVGTHVGAMAKLLPEIIQAVSTGGQPSPEAVGGVQRHNGPLVTVAMTLHGKLPGETVNGAFSHPSAAVNMIATTLDAMGTPLTDEQVVALGRVGTEFVAEDERRRESYGDDTLAMRRHVEESLLKGRFYGAAMDVLTDEQHLLLRPELTRGRVTADLFSASLVWVGRARPIPFRTPAHLAEILVERVGRDLELEGDARQRFAALITDWVNGLPNELMTREPDAMWLKGLVPIDAIDAAAHEQVTLMERMIADLDLSDEAIAELREHAGVFIPTWRPNP